jgi:hypothetical protein
MSEYHSRAAKVGHFGEHLFSPERGKVQMFTGIRGDEVGTIANRYAGAQHAMRPIRDLQSRLATMGSTMALRALRPLIEAQRAAQQPQASIAVRQPHFYIVRDLQTRLDRAIRKAWPLSSPGLLLIPASNRRLFLAAKLAYEGDYAARVAFLAIPC